MAPPRGTKLTDAQKADADLWLHKIAKMEFDGTNKNLVAGDIHSMANDGISATEELKVKTGTYQGGEFGLGKNITGSFSCPNGFTISMFKSDGLNCVAALIKNNNEARNMVIVTIKDPLNIPIIPPINKKADAIIDIIAPNFRMALLLKVVLFESIRSEHAS